MKKLFICLIVIINLLSLSCCNKDDFNLQEDIKNIYFFTKNEGVIVEPLPLHTLEQQIRNLETKTYYLVETNFDKTYILCGYVEKEEYKILERNLEYYENLTWIKYGELDEITESYDDKIISDLFIVYDFTIKKDILKKFRHIDNRSFKYYLNIKEDFENNLEIEKPYNQFLIWCYEDFGKMQQEGTKKLIFNSYDMQHTFEVNKANKDNYIIMNDKMVYEESNNIKYLLKGESGIYYDAIEKVAFNDDELTQYIEVNNGENYYLHKVKIKLKDFAEICKEAKK